MQARQIHDLLINPMGSKAISASGICRSKHQQDDLLPAMQVLLPLQNGHEVLLLLVGILDSLFYSSLNSHSGSIFLYYIGKNQP